MFRTVIKSFKDKESEKIFHGRFSRKLPRDIQRIAARKLEQLDAATILETLRVPQVICSRPCGAVDKVSIVYE
jgi:plasmid maintenance system killer protein